MPTITSTDGTEIFYKDWGSGQPIVFSHGWPLSADDWDTQMMFFLGHGYRVIAHDRRGHGRSAQVGAGHDMDQRGLLKDLGVPPRDAQIILGHSHVTTTQQIYTHVDEAARLDAITRLNKLLGGTE